MEFANIEYLFLLLLIIPYILWVMLYKRRNEATLHLADTFAYASIKKSLRTRFVWLPHALRLIVFVLIVLILARPQSYNSWGIKETEGIDIMMAMDVSTSMLAQDLKPNRIEAAKEVASEFIADRENDNIGLTVFAGEAFTQCPMTTDHQSLLNMLMNVRTDLAERGLIQDGTAIGMGLANAVARLKDSKTKSKVVILLTDGSNNMGDISPLTAAQIAKSYGIRVYTVAVGTKNLAPYPVNVGGSVRYVNLRADIDVETLQKIASSSGGNFYRATNTAELKKIYKDIDKLEKTRLNMKQFSKRSEAYMPLALSSVIILIIDMLLRLTIFKRLP